MDKEHIPRVVAKRRFLRDATVRGQRGEAPCRFVTGYEVKDVHSLNGCLDGPAKELREDFQHRYEGRSRLSRLGAGRCYPSLVRRNQPGPAISSDNTWDRIDQSQAPARITVDSKDG